MGVEIERRFLLRGEGWQTLADAGTPMRQGYLSLDPERTVRVRIAGERAFLTVKGRSHGARRAEFEWEIPRDEACTLLDTLCVAGIDKTRFVARVGAHDFEIDVFAGRNAGLSLVEIELSHEDEPFPRPEWLGDEVTHDHRYSNSILAQRPWPEL